MTDLHDEATSMPDDASLWATDALLDALSAGHAGDDDRAFFLLAALVSDVSAGLPEALSLPDDLHVRRSRLLRLAPRTAVALAAAAAVVSTGGVAAASVNAGPTSALFPLHQVLTGQPQLDGSQRQALEVRDKLQSASKALAAGKVDRARKDVTAAAGRIAKVAESDGRRDLAAQWTMLSKQVKARTVTPVAPVVVPTHTAAPTTPPVHSPSATPAPTTTSGTPRPTPDATTVTPGHTTAPTTSVVPVLPPVTSTGTPPTDSPTPDPTTTVPSTTPEPSDTAPTAPPASEVAPSAGDTPDPSGTAGKGHGHKGKGKGGSTPSAAPGSPVNPIVITPTPTDTPAPDDSTVPAPSASAAAPSASGYDGSVPTSSDSPPASSTPSANPLA